MKKILFIFILCGLFLTGCANKIDLDVTSETQLNTAPVTTFKITETVETKDTMTTATTIVTTIPDETTISAKEEVQTENVNPKATTTAPVATTKTATTTTTTVVSISTKQLDATLKAELVECAKLDISIQIITLIGDAHLLPKTLHGISLQEQLTALQMQK